MVSEGRVLFRAIVVREFEEAFESGLRGGGRRGVAEEVEVEVRRGIFRRTNEGHAEGFTVEGE